MFNTCKTCSKISLIKSVSIGNKNAKALSFIVNPAKRAIAITQVKPLRFICGAHIIFTSVEIATTIKRKIIVCFVNYISK
jgi:hypothetical protein